MSCATGSSSPRSVLRPAISKGGYGRTRWVPVLPELDRALRHHLWWLRLKFRLTPDLPPFPSREADGEGRVRPISRAQAHLIMKRVFAQAGIQDDGWLGAHSLRKTFARNVNLNADHDLMVLKSALGHSGVGTTQKYLEADEDRVMAAIARCDFTRRPRKAPATGVPPAAAIPAPLAAVPTAAWLPVISDPMSPLHRCCSPPPSTTFAGEC